MNTQTATLSQDRTGVLGAAIFSALIGLGIVATVGLAHAQTLHDAAHDVRHADGFPCH